MKDRIVRLKKPDMELNLADEGQNSEAQKARLGTELGG
jgi:hypothetical protein